MLWRTGSEEPHLKTTATQPDERLLVEEAQKDPRRFAELYEAHFTRVYAYVARRVPGRAETEDVTSEVFHRALAGLPRFEWRGAPFAAWLFRIAANAIADHFHRLAREGRAPEPTPREEANPEEDEERAHLFRLVDRLPEDQRRVILLRFAEEKSLRQVAGELGRTEGAVKQLQLRALKALRIQMSGSHG